MSSMDDIRRKLNRLTVLNQKDRLLHQEIDGLVAMLRSPGLDGKCEATWEQVGRALGITRQAAQMRYSGFSWGGRVIE